jgi:hypothetical protein
VASPLNNPYVVGGLVLGGACYALYTLVPEDWLERLGGTAKSSAVPPPLNVVAPQSLGPDNRFFIARPSGVPGAKSEAFNKTGFGWDIFHENPKASLARGPQALPEDWKLTGIYLDEKSQPPVRAAVVSGDILRPGNKKGEFLVEEITAESVIFSHPTGKQTLSFSKGTKAQKK